MAYDYDEIRMKVRDLCSNRETAADVAHDVWLALSDKTPAPDKPLRSHIIKQAALTILRRMPGGTRAPRAANTVSIEAAELDPASPESRASTHEAVAAILREMQAHNPELFRLATLTVNTRGFCDDEPDGYNKRLRARAALSRMYRTRFADMVAVG